MITAIGIIFFSLLPAILYGLVMYYTVSYNAVSLKKIFQYLAVGFLSVGLLKYIWYFYPEWHNISKTLGGNPLVDPFKYYHILYFVQVAFIEEISKLGVFLLYESYRRRKKTIIDHPVATMIYMGMISLGFSVIENIMYGASSDTPMTVLWWRGITSVVAHMIFGLFMGYWISLGRMKASEDDPTTLDVSLSGSTIGRNIVFTIIGFFSATILHGIYDLHLEMNGPSGITGVYILLLMSLLGVYWCFRNLTKLHNKNKTNKIED